MLLFFYVRLALICLQSLHYMTDVYEFLFDVDDFIRLRLWPWSSSLTPSTYFLLSLVLFVECSYLVLFVCLVCILMALCLLCFISLFVCVVKYLLPV